MIIRDSSQHEPPPPGRTARPASPPRLPDRAAYRAGQALGAVLALLIALIVFGGAILAAVWVGNSLAELLGQQ